MSTRPPCPCAHRPDVACDASHCDLAPRGAAYDAAAMCRVCWLYHHDRAFNLAWGGDGDTCETGATARQAPVPRRRGTDPAKPRVAKGRKWD